MAQIIQFSSGMSNGFFVKKDDAVVLVDTGMVKDGADFIRHCTEAGISPSQIRLVVVSHEHHDHFMRLDEILKIVNAPVMCHNESFTNLSQGLKPTVKTRDGSPPPGADGRPSSITGTIPKVMPDILLNSGCSLADWGVDAELIHTPGHSRGSLTLVTEKSVIVGDIIVGLPDGGIRTAKYADDEAALKNSVLEIISHAPETVYSGHAAPVSADEFLAVYEAEWAEMQE